MVRQSACVAWAIVWRATEFKGNVLSGERVDTMLLCQEYKEMVELYCCSPFDFPAGW